MQRLEISGAVRPLWSSLGVYGLMFYFGRLAYFTYRVVVMVVVLVVVVVVVQYLSAASWGVTVAMDVSYDVHRFKAHTHTHTHTHTHRHTHKHIYIVLILCCNVVDIIGSCCKLFVDSIQNRCKIFPRNSYSFHFLTECKVSMIRSIGPNECPVPCRCFADVEFELQHLKD